MEKKHSNKLDEEKLAFACELIDRKREGRQRKPVEILADALLIMQFGQISMQDMMDYIEACYEAQG